MFVREQILKQGSAGFSAKDCFRLIGNGRGLYLSCCCSRALPISVLTKLINRHCLLLSRDGGLVIKPQNNIAFTALSDPAIGMCNVFRGMPFVTAAWFPVGYARRCITPSNGLIGVHVGSMPSP